MRAAQQKAARPGGGRAAYKTNNVKFDHPPIDLLLSRLALLLATSITSGAAVAALILLAVRLMGGAQ
jgi:hypothetical protein